MISVVVTTYNGEKYIRDQLESILTQTLLPDEIIIVDDASKDSVCAIAEQLLNEADIPFILHKNTSNIGYLKAFEIGLNIASGDYIAFADQDDVWHKDKLEQFRIGMKELEKENGMDMPFITFSDVEITDSNLNIISNSFDKPQKLHTARTHSIFHSLCVQNVISGMSMMINRKLANLVLPFPDHAIHHDWWMALVCAKCGKIKYLEKPLVYYRQHGSNVIGANLYDDITWFNQIRTNLNHPRAVFRYVFHDLRYELYENYRCHVRKHSEQKLALAELVPEDAIHLKKIAFHLRRGGLLSIIWLITHNILPPAWQRKVFFCISMLKKFN